MLEEGDNIRFLQHADMMQVLFSGFVPESVPESVRQGYIKHHKVNGRHTLHQEQTTVVTPTPTLRSQPRPRPRYVVAQGRNPDPKCDAYTSLTLTLPLPLRLTLAPVDYAEFAGTSPDLQPRIVAEAQGP